MAPKGAASLPRQGAPNVVLIDGLDDASFVPNITRKGTSAIRVRIPTGAAALGNGRDVAK
jgi:hypothetical protein